MAKRLTIALAGTGLLSGAIFSLGCSLTGVADFELPECKDDAECRAAFNPERGYYAECAAFKCESRGKRKECVEVPSEVFDGQDNDCDRLIDETASGEPIIETEERAIARAVSSQPTQATLARSAGFGEALYYASMKDGFVVSLGEESAEPEKIHLVTQVQANADPNKAYGSAQLKELERGCYAPAPPLASCDLDSDAGKSACLNQRTSIGDCDFGDLAAAAGTRRAFFASLRVDGCPAGELRVGIVDPSAKTELIARGLGARDATYRGVATRGSACSDNGSAACQSAKQAGNLSAIADACGVSRPRIAALKDQALTAFLGLPASSSECKPGTKVFGLALHEQSDIFDGEYFWSNPSHDGEPDVLGTTNGGGAPGLIALRDLGYLVAFGNEEEELELHFIPTQTAPDATPVQGDLLNFPAYEDRSAYPTAPLGGVTTIGRFQETGRIDGVQLALIEIGERRVKVGLSWLDGCTRTGGRTDSYFKLIELDLSDNIPAVAFEAQRVELGSSTRAPLVLASQCPFVVPGLARGGRTASRDEESGFYVLTSPADEAPSAVRIAAFDGQMVDPKETLSPLPNGSAYLSATEPGSILGYSEDQELVLTTFACGD